MAATAMPVSFANSSRTSALSDSTEQSSSLTGVWHGLYSYITQPWMPDSHFVAVLFDSGGHLSGVVHEVMNYPRGVKLKGNAAIIGRRHESSVDFEKIYDGTGGMSHVIIYSGTLSADRSEIEGLWEISSPPPLTGRFLMIRNRGIRSAEKKQILERA